jgi:hypothetical protein
MVLPEKNKKHQTDLMVIIPQKEIVWLGRN